MAAAASRTAPEATPAASAALRAITWIETPISSAPVATVLTCLDTWCEEADASAIWVLVADAAPEISALTSDSCCEALASPTELLETSEIAVRMLAIASSRQTAIRPISSLPTTPTDWVRSPRARPSRTVRTRRTGRTIAPPIGIAMMRNSTTPPAIAATVSHPFAVRVSAIWARSSTTRASILSCSPPILSSRSWLRSAISGSRAITERWSFAASRTKASMNVLNATASGLIALRSARMSAGSATASSSVRVSVTVSRSPGRSAMMAATSASASARYASTLSSDSRVSRWCSRPFADSSARTASAWSVSLPWA